MEITSESLKDKDVCLGCIEWFDSHFPKGAEYQTALDKAAETDQPDFARLLLSKFGKTDVVLNIEKADGKHIFFAGSIRVKKGISLSGFLIAGGGIEAGEGIKAGWGIEAGEGIKAGWGIKAGEGIKAGLGFGIFAGLNIKLAEWSSCAVVSAAHKPINLVSGSWREKTQ